MRIKNNSCLEIGSTEVSWFEAADICRRSLGRLAMLSEDHVQTVRDHVTQITNQVTSDKKFWVGLKNFDFARQDGKYLVERKN